MKRFISFILLAVFANVFLFADINGHGAAQINLQHKKHSSGHFDQPIPFDQPDVYYNSGTQVSIIDGGGEVSYYDVEIESMTTWLTVISTQVSGTYDTIDVSSLATGDYIITITSPTGHEFEGYFEIKKQ